MDGSVELTLRLPSSVDRTALFGAAERNLKLIREALGVTIGARDDVVSVKGERHAVHAARVVLERLIDAGERRSTLTRQQLLDAIADASWRSQHGNAQGPALTTEADNQLAQQVVSRQRGAHEPVAPRRAAGKPGGLSDFEIRPIRPVDDEATIESIDPSWSGSLDVYAGGRPIVPRSPNQQYYLDAIRRNDLVFGMGPAGTGKTYLAVAAAVHLLRIGRVRRAILARPAVEAGEKLGFLPGDQYAKLNPYLRPLFDALQDMMDYATINKFMANDIVEIVPLAYMRGRTLNDAIIILDEAQNTTRGQMQMFLTRMGQRSKVIVTGDVTQIDLPDPTESGLIDAARRLRRTPGVAFVQLERADVVRHPLVQRVIDAYAAESAEVDAMHRALLSDDNEQPTDHEHDAHAEAHPTHQHTHQHNMNHQEERHDG